MYVYACMYVCITIYVSTHVLMYVFINVHACMSLLLLPYYVNIILEISITMSLCSYMCVTTVCTIAFYQLYS